MKVLFIAPNINRFPGAVVLGSFCRRLAVLMPAVLAGSSPLLPAATIYICVCVVRASSSSDKLDRLIWCFDHVVSCGEMGMKEKGIVCSVCQVFSTLNI